MENLSARDLEGIGAICGEGGLEGGRRNIELLGEWWDELDCLSAVIALELLSILELVRVIYGGLMPDVITDTV